MSLENTKKTVELNNLNENIEVPSKLTKGESDESIESKMSILDASLKSANKEFTDIGGETGIEVTLGSTFLETDKTLKENILKAGATENSIDGMWDITKMMLSGNMFNSKEAGYQLFGEFQRITGNGAGVVMGLALLPATGGMKGLQQLSRKIKLVLEKIKSRN